MLHRLFASSTAASNSVYWDKESREKTVGIKANADKNAFAFARSELFGGLGAMSFAFVCHHSTFIVHNSMMVQTEKEWATVSRISISIALLACMTLGLSGYLSFFEFVSGCPTILASTGAITVARILLAITMVLTYPMELFVARKALHAIIYGPNVPITIHRHYALTFTLFVLTLTVGMVTADLGFVLEFTGAISASIIGYIVPPLLYMTTPAFLTAGTRSEKFKVYGLLIFGVVAMIAGSITAIVNAVSRDDCSYTPQELSSQRESNLVIYQNCTTAV